MAQRSILGHLTDGPDGTFVIHRDAILRIKVGVGVGRSAAVDGQRQPKVGQRTQKHDHAHGEQQPGGPLLGGILRVNVFRHGKNLLFTISYIV